MASLDNVPDDVESLKALILAERAAAAEAKRTKVDARAYAVKFTKEGQHVLTEATKPALEAEEILATSAGLSAKGRADLAGLLKSLTKTNQKSADARLIAENARYAAQ